MAASASSDHCTFDAICVALEVAMMDLDPLIAYLIVVYAISTVSLVYCNTFNYDQR